MRGTASHLLEFLEGARKRFIIPVYQRNYDWKRENCKQLFDDLVNLIKEEKKTHFFGSIVSYAHGREEVVLIDGQQRITTVSLIMIAMINAMKKGLLIPEDKRLCEIIENTYIIDKYRPDERKVRLKPFRDDCAAFDKLIFKDESEYKEDSKVTINYRYFYERIVNQKELTADELFKAIDNLEIIDIEIEPEHGDNPQLIFESLNSTGLDLTEADKIRNYVLMGLLPDVQERYYDNYWNKIERFCDNELDGFVRNYLTIVTGIIPNIKGIYAAFKAYSRGLSDIEPLLADMLRYASVFKRITSYNIGAPEANGIIKRLELLDVSVAYPFLMAFLVYAQETELSDEEVVKVLSCIETFAFRRLICGLPTNALNKIFATLHNAVLKHKSEGVDYSAVLIYYLESRKMSSAFPKDEEFIQGFTTRNIYSMRAKNKEYIFERLENGSSKEKNDVVDNIERGILTIEHIMPQTLNPSWKQALGEDYERIQEQWLHTISNLTLTGYNSNYSNRPFLEKRDMENGFCQSGIRLNRFVAQCSKWTEEELEQRKENLSKLALSIWAYPTTDFAPVQKEDDIVSLSEDNGIAVGRKLSGFIFQDTQYNATDWADMMLEVVKILYSINPSILYQEAANQKNVWFCEQEQTRAVKKIAENLYFSPSGNGTWNKFAILKNLFRLYQIDEEELSFILQAQKEDSSENEENLSDFDDSSTKHKRSSSKTPPRTEAKKWIIPANPEYFNHRGSLKKYGYVYWRQHFNFQTGDTIYIYVSSPDCTLRYKCLVDGHDLTYTPEMDVMKEFYSAPEDFEYLKKHNRILKLNLLEETSSDKMTLTHLLENGMNKAPQGCLNLSGEAFSELLNYIESNF